jgi:hypothetical protein
MELYGSIGFGVPSNPPSSSSSSLLSLLSENGEHSLALLEKRTENRVTLTSTDLTSIIFYFNFQHEQFNNSIKLTAASKCCDKETCKHVRLRTEIDLLTFTGVVVVFRRVLRIHCLGTVQDKNKNVIQLNKTNNNKP